MRARYGAVLLLLALTTTACVGVPDSGPVVQTRSQGDISSDSGIYFDPRPPQDGDSRSDIVRGFINAMTATPIRTTRAREFLTADADAAWDPQKRTITYALTPTPRESANGVSLTLTGADVLDSRGAWRGALPEDERTISFPMSMEDGQWRIDSAPDALILPETWFERNYRQKSLYFFDPTASTLVPEPVYVPTGQALATTLTRGLLMGPAEGLERVTQSFVPRGLKVSVGVAVSDDGVADIPLIGDAGTLTSNAVALMMAQFAWTLRQDPTIEAIRVSIDGTPVPLPGGATSFRVDGGAEYDPAGLQASPLLYGLQDGRLVSGTANALGPVDGPLGHEDYGVRSIGVNLEASRVAAVATSGTSLRSGPLTEDDDGRVDTVVSGATDLLRPAWDLADRIWLVDRTARGARVTYVEDDTVSSLRVPGITGERVRSFLVSRDGTRLVALLRRRSGTDTLVVSRIEHGSAGRVLGATRAKELSVEGEIQLPIRAIAWRTPTSIAVLSPFTPSVAQVRLASVDGSPVGSDSSSSTVEGRLRDIAGSPAPGEETYGVTSNSLIVLFGADRRITPIDAGVTEVVYVG
ncbi:MAG: hypothetical protein JWN91_3561 [Nocardioides sp.]|nr:hypothetical protein [Nocardioides sp.]